MKWIQNNIWNLVGAIGTIATLSFGLIGLLIVPDYVKDIEYQKQKTANVELISDMQELVYTNQKIDSALVITLITGKEIKYGINFPYSPDSLLIELQESFISQRFLPIELRKELYDRTDSIRYQISKSQISKIGKSKSEKSSMWQILLSIISSLLIALSAGIFYGLIIRRKKEVEKEVEEKIEEIEQNRPSNLINYKKFEQLVASVLEKFDYELIDYTQKPQDYGFDFLIKKNDKSIAVEVKGSMNTDAVHRIRHQFDKYKPDALIIVSNRLQKIVAYSKLRELGIVGRKIYSVTGFDSESIYMELEKIFNIEFGD